MTSDVQPLPSRTSGWSAWKHAGLAGLAGVLYFTGFAGVDIWPLSLVCLLPLFVILDGPAMSGRRALWVGLLFGSVTNWGGYYWLIEMLENFSGFPYAACIFFALVICFYQGGQLGLFFWLMWRGKQMGWPLVWIAAPAYAATEAIYPLLFPSYFANCLHELPILNQIADLGGPTIISALMVLVNAAAYATYRALRRQASMDRRLLGVCAGLVVATLVYGAYRMAEVDARVAAAQKITVGAVQANMGIFEKRQDRQEGHRRHLAHSARIELAHSPDLIIWPESAFGWSITDETDNVGPAMGTLTTPLLFGGLSRRTVDGQPKVYNTAFMVDAMGHIKGTVDKTFLLAFGEYLPLGDKFPILYDWSPNSGRFTPGNHQRPLPLGDYRITTLVCYEDVLPAFVRSAVQVGNPHLLVNVANDSWFGDTTEPWIHLALAKLRAIEHHRFLVRATNSGVSAVVDPAGRVVTHTQTFERAEMVAEVAMLQGNSLFLMLGDWPGWAGLLLSVAACLRRRSATSLP